MQKFNPMMLAASLLIDPVSNPEAHQALLERRIRQKAAKAPMIGKKLKDRQKRKNTKSSKRKNRR